MRPAEDPVRSHHLVLRLGVDAHHARVAVGNLLLFVVARSKSKSSLYTKSQLRESHLHTADCGVASFDGF